MKKQAMNAIQTQILEKRRKMIVDNYNTVFERNKIRAAMLLSMFFCICMLKQT